MDFSELGKTIAKAAPILGSILGGPAGGAVGALISAKFGGDSSNADDLYKRIQADPESEVKLKQIEADHDIELKTLAITSENNRLSNETAQLKIVSDNQQNARDNNAKSKKLSDETIKVLLVMFTFLVIGVCLTGIFKKVITGDEIPIVTMILGVFLSEVKNYNGFYFSDSIGSRNKDDLLFKSRPDNANQ